MKRAGGIAAIVKVQLPLFASTTGALVYDRARKHVAEQPLPPAVHRHVLTTPRRKAFFDAVWMGDAWEIGALTADQPW